MAFSSIPYGDAAIATHSIVEDFVPKQVERVAPGAGVLGAWDATGAATAVGLVPELSADTAGKGRIIVGVLCEEALAAVLKFRLVFKNSAGFVIGLSAEVESSLTELDDGAKPAKRYGTLTIFANDAGASTAEVYITAMPGAASSVTLMLAAL